MTAKTPYWICGKCGFRNHPQLLRQPDNSTIPKPVNKCEQCGNDGFAALDLVSIDYTP
jgi:ribosomal protein S27AE